MALFLGGKPCKNGVMGRGRRRWMRWTIWLVVAGALLLYGGYAYLTNPDRLRAQALAALQRLHIDGLTVGQVVFRPGEGLWLTNLTVRADASERMSWHGGDAPPLMHIAEVEVHCDLWALLVGKLRPTEVVLRGVGLSLIGSSRLQDSGWRLGPEHVISGQWDQMARLLDRALPRVRVEQADVQFLTVREGQLQVFQRWPMHAVGEATREGYALRVYPLTSTRDALLELTWSAAARELSLGFDWAELATLRRMLPAVVNTRLDALGFNARVRVGYLTLRLPSAATDAGRPRPTLTAAAFDLAGVRFSVPIEDETVLPSDRFLHVRAGTLEAKYRADEPGAPGRLRVKGGGQLNGATVEMACTTVAGVLPRIVQAAAGGEPNVPGLAEIVHGTLRITGLQLPTEESAPAFVRAAALRGPIGHTLERYQPYGEVDVAVRILPPADEGRSSASVPARVEVIVASRSGGCTYQGFPYRFEDAAGRLRYTGGRLLVEDLCGRHGHARICADGVINNTSAWSGFELTFRGTNVALDEDLYRALPAEHQRLWRSARPVGIADVMTNVSRPDGTPETGPAEPTIEVLADLLHGSLDLERGRRLQQARGRLRIEGERVVVEGLRGCDGDTAVRLDGELAALGDETQVDLRVELANLPVSYETSFEPQSVDATSPIAFHGQADAWGRTWGAADAAERHQHYAVRIRDGRMTGRDAERPWTDVRGWICVHDHAWEIRELVARQGDARLYLAGEMREGTLPKRLELEVTAAQLEEILPQLVPATWATITERVGLRGAGSVSLLLDRRPEDGEPRAHAVVRAADMQAEPLPLPLANVEAQLTLGPGEFELLSSSAQASESGHVTAQAKVRWNQDEPEATMTVTAETMMFSPELLAALPRPLRRVLEPLAPAGEFDAHLSRIRFVGGGRPSWEFEGRVPLRNARMQLGFELTDLHGLLNGRCRIGPDGQATLESEMTIDRARLAGRPIEGWHAGLERRPGDSRVHVTDLRGRICDGDLVGWLSIDASSGEYELSLTVRDISVAKLFPAPADAEQSPHRGRVEGEIQLRGIAGDAASRRGSGVLRLSGAALLSTPVVAKVAEAREPNVPLVDKTVDMADVRFLWEGRTLQLLRVDIRSANLRLVGEGRWNLADDSIRMTLLGAHPEDWQRIPLLTDLVESAGQELVQYQIEGTLRAPEVTARPLYRLDDALRRLLGAE